MASKAQLYIRVVIDGNRLYQKPVWSANHKLKAQFAVVNGKIEHHPEGVYHLRLTTPDGRRVWERIGEDPHLAVTRLQQRNLALQAEALGMAVPEPAVVSTASPAAPAPKSEPEPKTEKHPLKESATEYLAETKIHKSKKTHLAYQFTLEGFLKVCHKQNLEDVTRKDVLDYIASLRERGNAPRTLANRASFLNTFLLHYELKPVLAKKDRPKYTEKVVRAYSTIDIGKLLGRATKDEADLLMFLLCTGAREQEVQFACWSDVDFTAKTYTVTEHLDLGYRPKDKEEGAIPIPTALVELLQDRRKRHPKTRLIFPIQGGKKPDGHLLRTIKRLALKAGVNCGHCVNKAGQSCAKHPVCSMIGLHKCRKTFATAMHRNGMPARTLMRLLRHSDLNTTLRYLADVDDEQTRGIVESTFTAFAGGAR